MTELEKIHLIEYLYYKRPAKKTHSHQVDADTTKHTEYGDMLAEQRWLKILM